MDSRHGTTLLRAHDVEAAEQLCADFYPHRLDRLETTTPFDWRMYVSQLGPMCIADCEFGSDVRIRLGELGSYHVSIPLTRSLVSTQHRSTVTATARTAAVYQPVGATVLDRWAGNCRVLSIKIETGALESALAASIGRDSPPRSTSPGDQRYRGRHRCHRPNRAYTTRAADIARRTRRCRRAGRAARPRVLPQGHITGLARYRWCT